MRVHGGEGDFDLHVSLATAEGEDGDARGLVELVQRQTNERVLHQLIDLHLKRDSSCQCLPSMMTSRGAVDSSSSGRGG